MSWTKYSLFTGICAVGVLSFAVTGYLLDSAKGSDAGLNLASKATKNSSKSSPSARSTALPTEQAAVIKLNDDDEEETKVTLNDPALKEAWGFQKIQAERALQLHQGSENLIVAVIDTGAQLDHEDAPNWWRNPGETGIDSQGRDKATNRIDDDKNGFVDDVHGYNFVSRNNDLTDNHGHGTHIAGIIGARASNGKGIAGVSPNVQVMVLKYYDPKNPNTDNLKNTIDAIYYAIEKNAHIINYSGGGTEFSAEEKKAVAAAEEAGILFVAAAGNERSNSDIHKYYPADYGLSNIISVTAIDPMTEVLPSSNFGIETVDLAAPGHNILSLLPGNKYGKMTGTSQATAFVSSAAALVMSRHPEFSAADVKKYILATGDSRPSLLAKTRTSRQLNMFKAMTMMDTGLSLAGKKIVNQPNLQALTVSSPVALMSEFSKNLMQQVQPKANSRLAIDPNVNN